MVRETPELYRRIVQPYIASFPKSRTQWCVVFLEFGTIALTE